MPFLIKTERLKRPYGLVASELSEQLDVTVRYVPVIDYAAAVTGFRRGDLDLVWFGGLTGVQARLQTPGAVLAQRMWIPASARCSLPTAQPSRGSHSVDR